MRKCCDDLPEKDMAPCKLVRFTTHGKPGDTAGWCKLFADCVGFSFSCNREDTYFVWQQRDSNALPPSKQERQAVRVKSEQVRQQGAAELAAQHANTATVAALSLDSWLFCLLEFGLGSCERNPTP